MKKLIVPLQAFAALFICGGMAWMVFVIASLNSTPPTALDLQARSTKDLSVADLNSTAVALAQQMLANLIPSPAGPIFLPITGRGTPSPVPMALVTLRPVATGTLTAQPFSFFSFLFPPTRTKKPDAPTFTPVNTPTRTLALSTLTPSFTPVTATVTNRPTITPTFTEEPSATATLAPTDTDTPVPTDTSIPDTETPVPPSGTPEPPPTDTDTPVPPPPQDTDTPAPPDTETPVG